MDDCYNRLKEDVLSFREKRTVEDFNARVGRSVDLVGIDFE